MGIRTFSVAYFVIFPPLLLSGVLFLYFLVIFDKVQQSCSFIIEGINNDQCSGGSRGSIFPAPCSTPKGLDSFVLTWVFREN